MEPGLAAAVAAAAVAACAHAPSPARPGRSPPARPTETVRRGRGGRAARARRGLGAGGAGAGAARRPARAGGRAGGGGLLPPRAPPHALCVPPPPPGSERTSRRRGGVGGRCRWVRPSSRAAPSVAGRALGSWPFEARAGRGGGVGGDSAPPDRGARKSSRRGLGEPGYPPKGGVCEVGPCAEELGQASVRPGSCPGEGAACWGGGVGGLSVGIRGQPLPEERGLGPPDLGRRSQVLLERPSQDEGQ